MMAVVGLALGCAVTRAHAVADDKSRYSLVRPTPRAVMREMSTDRPDTTESPYTLDAGHVQIEMSFVDYTHDRRNDEGVTTRTLAIAPMLLKLGLLNNVDIQVGIDPYTHARTKDRATGTTETLEGFGDTVVRLKVNLWGNDEGETALGVMPYVKFPTADDEFSNGEVEWGIIVPLAVALPGEFSLGLMAEFDVIRSGADDRYVVDFVHSATISHALAGDLGGYVEYAGFMSLNAEEDYRGYLDLGLTYAMSDDVQFDAGVRVGLTRAAEDVGVFAGVSLRY